MEASYYESAQAGLICRLCPHNCVIPAGKTGICRVRRNVSGVLQAETWGRLSALQFDPVEKKPLYHFHPGKSILSLGSVGCNMKCNCCQNWHISQATVTGFQFKKETGPKEIVNLAVSRKDSIGVAYTYNEPAVWFEYMYDIAEIVHLHGLKNVMVSNGFIREKPLHDLLTRMDAFNIDLKGFTEDFYRTFAGASLAPVLRTLKQVRKSGKHLEITNLVITSVNDDPWQFGEMINWIAGELGADTVLHLSRYHPDYNMKNDQTPVLTLDLLYGIARKKLSYVYIGNILLNRMQDTHCINCGELLVARQGYLVSRHALTDNGLCRNCGRQVITC